MTTAIGRILTDNLFCCFNTIQNRHPDVHNYHIRLERRTGLDRVTSVLGFTDNFQVWLALQQRAQAGAHHRVVVREIVERYFEIRVLCRTGTSLRVDISQSSGSSESGQSGIVKKLRILLADDHTVMRTGLRALLERQPNLEVVGESEERTVTRSRPVRRSSRMW